MRNTRKVPLGPEGMTPPHPTTTYGYRESSPKGQRVVHERVRVDPM